MKNIKLFAMFVAGLSLAALATYAAPVAIEAAINSFTLYMNRVIITTTGGPDGATVVDINNMDSSAALLVNSTTRGFLPPRLTTAQRDAISNPANGLIIFNSDLGFHQSYNGPSGNQPEYWQGVGTACPSISILEVESTDLDPVLEFGAGFHSIGENDNAINTAADVPENLLGMATIAGISFYVEGALIIDTNNNRVLSAMEKSLFDDSTLYGTLYMRPSGLIPLAGVDPGNSRRGRSILGGVVAENSDMFLYICGDIVPGCTDSSAENYDPQANIDDESCTQTAQVDMYFASGSSAIYSANTGSNITFYSEIANALCADAVGSTVTVTATWNATSGMSPSYMSSSFPYGSANIAGNTATWTIDPIYIGCSNLPLSVTLYNGALGEVTVDWTVGVAGDSNLGNDIMSQYGEWTASQGGGGGSYDYAIYSGNRTSFSTTSSGTLYPSIIVGGDAYNGCIAGYGIQVTASLPTATANYIGSSGGMMNTPGSYNGSTVTRTYMGTDSMQCSYLANSAVYGVSLYSTMSGSDTIYWSIGPALTGSSDGNPMNNYTTQYLTRSMPGGGGANYDYGISSGTPSYPTTTAGSNITSTIYPIQAATACQAGYGISVVAQLPAGASYIGSSGGMMGQMGTYDSMMSTVTWNYTGTDSMQCNYLASSSYAYSITLNSATAYSGNITWSVQAANAGNTDSNLSNNNGTAYFTWTAGGGGANYDYGVSSGTIAYPTATAGSNLSSSINIINAQTACEAGYGIRVVAQLPWGASSYVSSSAGMMGQMGTYDSMMNTVTWNYTGTTTCRDLATEMYAYTVTLNSATAFSGTVTWSVSAANAGNTDSNIVNNNGTHYINWTAGGGVDVLVSTPMVPSSGSVGSSLTGSIYMSELSGNIANNVTITATLPDWMSSADPATLVGATAGYSQSDNVLTRNIGSASSAGPYQVVLQGNAAETQYVYRNITTSDSDTNAGNNTYNMPFARY